MKGSASYPFTELRVSRSKRNDGAIFRPELAKTTHSPAAVALPLRAMMGRGGGDGLSPSSGLADAHEALVRPFCWTLLRNFAAMPKSVEIWGNLRGVGAGGLDHFEMVQPLRPKACVAGPDCESGR